MKTDYSYLDRNEFNFKPSDKVAEACRNFDVDKLCFYTRIYDEGKKSIFSVYLSELYGIPEDRVILGYGAEDILKQTVHYFLTREGRNNTMLIPRYSWWYYKSLADEVNGRTVEYPLFETESSFEYDFDTLRRMLEEEKPSLLLLASPNNPTGNGLTPEQIEEVMQMAGGETTVVVDEAYASFVTDDNSYIARLLERHPNLVFARTLSKFYGLPGLRMGFAFIGAGMEGFTRYSNKYLGYNRFSEDVAIAALQSDEHYRHVAESMNADRRRYAAEIGTLPGFKVYDSVANFILVKYPVRYRDALKEAFAKERYKIKFMNEPDLNEHLRITLGRPEQNAMVIDTIKRIAAGN